MDIGKLVHIVWTKIYFEGFSSLMDIGKLVLAVEK